MALLKSFGPWQLDSELRQLAPAPGGSPKLLRLFLTTLQRQLDSCRDFELAQAYLGLFLKVRTAPFILLHVCLVCTLQQCSALHCN